jgi:hypothetical protein
MDFLINLLTDPKVLSLLSLPTICMSILGYMLYKLFLRYDHLQEVRIEENKKMLEEYTKLCNDINKTLDTLLRVMGKCNNGGSK